MKHSTVSFHPYTMEYCYNRRPLTLTIASECPICQFGSVLTITLTVLQCNTTELVFQLCRFVGLYIRLYGRGKRNDCTYLNVVFQILVLNYIITFMMHPVSR